MNIIPIVTVDDLADNSFQKTKGKLDFKLSKQASNGLVLSENGLAYTSAGGASPLRRLLLGAMVKGGDDTRVITLGAFEVELTLADLGSDGRYLNFGVRCEEEMRINVYRHLDHNNYGYGNEEGTIFTYNYQSNWNNDKQRLHICYEKDGVNYAILVSMVVFGEGFYVWADIIDPVAQEEEEDKEDGNGGSGANFYAGRTYPEIWLTQTMGLDLVLLECNDPEEDILDVYIARIDHNGKPAEPLVGIPDYQWYRHSYDYKSNALVLLMNDGQLLKIIDQNRNIVDFDMGLSDTVHDWAIETSVGENEVDTMITLVSAGLNLVVVYRYSPVDQQFTEVHRRSVDFNTLSQGVRHFEATSVKILDDEHIAFAFTVADENWNWSNRLTVLNTTTDAIKAEQALENGFSISVEDKPWIINRGDMSNSVRLYEMTVDGINVVVETEVPNIDYVFATKAPSYNWEIPGIACFHYDTREITIITPVLVDDNPDLQIQKVVAEVSPDKQDGQTVLGFSEVKDEGYGLMQHYLNSSLTFVENKLTSI